MKKKIITGAIALAMVLSVFMPNINNANAANYNEAEVLYEDEEVDISKMAEAKNFTCFFGSTTSNTKAKLDDRYYVDNKVYIAPQGLSISEIEVISSEPSSISVKKGDDYIVLNMKFQTIATITVRQKDCPDNAQNFIFRVGTDRCLDLKKCVVSVDTSADNYDDVASLVTVTYNGTTLVNNTDYTLSSTVSSDGSKLTVTLNGLGLFASSNVTKTFTIKQSDSTTEDNPSGGNTGDSGDNSGDNNQNDNGGSGNESGNNSQDNGNGDSSDSGNSDHGNNNSGTDTGSNSNSDTGNNNTGNNNSNSDSNNNSSSDTGNNNNSNNNDGNTNNNNSSSDNQNTGSNVLPWSNVNPSENGNGGNTSDNCVNNSDNNGNSNGGSDNVATDTKDIIGFYLDTSGDIRCNDLDGTPVINKFMCDGTYTYYFQLDGTAMKDRLTYHPDGVHVIYFDSEGHEVFSDFANVKKTIAGDAVDDFCFFDVFGYMYVDVLTYDKTGSVLYYANPYGVMEMGKWFQFSDTVEWADGTPAEGIAGGYGYANADGTLMTNTQTVDWEGRSCYLQGNGVALY